MNAFYDISDQTDLPIDALQLSNLGSEKVYASIGTTTRDGWGGRNTEWSRHTTAVQPEDYDRQFAYKLNKYKPVYDMGKILDYHFNHYCSTHLQGQSDFLKHMRYVVLPILKKLNNSEVCATLLEQWIEEKTTVKKDIIPHTVNNNTINIGTVNAPTQFQQNSDYSVQTQHNHLQKEQIKEFLEVLREDIQNVDESIRNDFALEMDYAVAQLNKDRDIKPQLLTIGGLMKDVGIGTFTNVLAAPIYEMLKPLLGIS
ncbi:hypothetical protein [Sphingobacterium suaedae]|uniref:Uncharacterized protein n=1 Tax=Sphingobacterium suaedae TaxID=1686402 RepID=A0ABW5KKQ9_9SPHI